MTSTTTAPRPRTEASRPSRGNAVTGTATLARFMLRRDRLRLPLWVGGLTAATVATLSSYMDVYPTEADRQAGAAAMESPAMVAMAGRNPAPHDYTYGALLTHQMLWLTVVMVALMSVLLFVRHTRVEEASGRAELVRANVVGRHANTAAAVLVVGVANVGLALLLAVSLGSQGIEGITWQGSLLYGAAHAAVGLVFIGVAAVAVQISEHSRGAAGIGIAGIGLAYGLRAIGDVGENALSWLSPFGWVQATEAYVTDRWAPLGLALAVTVVLVAVGVALSTRRDVGAGLRAPRPGPATATDRLTSPLGLAFRLQRANLLGWVAGLFLLGAMYGSVLGDAEQMLADIEALEDLLPEAAGISLVESFGAMVATVMAILASVYAVIAALKARAEESAGRAEPLLVASVSRTRWFASHLLVAMGGSVMVLLAGGLGLGAAGAAATEQANLLPRLLGAALAYVPALWLVIGVVALLFGILPRAATAGWAVVVYAFVADYLGPLLQFPDWMTRLSPFGHVPNLPVEDLTWAPLLILAAIAAALIAGRYRSALEVEIAAPR